MADPGEAARLAEESDLVAGSDQDGLVTMKVTADRGYVVDVALRPDWRNAIVSTELAPTVLAAFHAAQAAAMARQLEIVDDAVADGPPPAAETGPAPAAAPVYMRNLISTVLSQLDGYTKRATRAHATRFEADSPKRAVTVGATGGQVNTVTIDLEWARHAPAADLTREIHAAFAAVQEQTAELAAEVGGPTSEMTELTELASDPALFLRLLGMRGGEANTS